MCVGKRKQTEESQQLTKKSDFLKEKSLVSCTPDITITPESEPERPVLVAQPPISMLPKRCAMTSPPKTQKKRQTDRQTQTQTRRQTDRQTLTQTRRQTDKHSRQTYTLHNPHEVNYHVVIDDVEALSDKGHNSYSPPPPGLTSFVANSRISKQGFEAPTGSGRDLNPRLNITTTDYHMVRATSPFLLITPGASNKRSRMKERLFKSYYKFDRHKDNTSLKLLTKSISKSLRCAVHLQVSEGKISSPSTQHKARATNVYWWDVKSCDKP
ncbi:hypothetical protein PoB_001673800 [Plakobranchus ocellatus]|uniref:Uncharacterized protein n=1 Tax=Plakobranchus ocellatus TaxID=259542 RepID=A0AAV3Z6Z1_9GAST|nr:hypothetical protein PoB_001673800 [Plakobranchus ocellatus]